VSGMASIRPLGRRVGGREEGRDGGRGVKLHDDERGERVRARDKDKEKERAGEMVWGGIVEDDR
jgi:hypothetical protein